MSCEHLAVHEVRVYPEAGESRDLVMGVASACAEACLCGVGLHDATGRLRAWLFRGFCRECEQRDLPTETPRR